MTQKETRSAYSEIKDTFSHLGRAVAGERDIGWTLMRANAYTVRGVIDSSILEI